MPKFTVKTPTGAISVDAPDSSSALDMVLGSTGPNVSSLGSFGRGVASSIPLGEQAYSAVAGAAQNEPYAQERQELTNEIGQDKQVNPGARLAGQATGLVAPIVATGGLAAPEGLGEAALQGGLIGSGFGAGNAIDTKASGGSDTQALTQLGLGAATGAAGGAAGEGLSGLLGKFAGVSLPSEEEFTAGNTAGVLQGTSRQVKNLPGKNPIEALNKIGDQMRTTQVDGKPLVSVFDRSPDTLDKMLTLQKQSGKVIGDTIEQSNVPPMSLTEITTNLGDTRYMTPVDKSNLQSALDTLKAAGDKDGNISFQALQAEKSAIGKKAFPKSGDGDPVLQNLYHAVSTTQDNELDKLSGIINKPDFDLAKRQYQLTAKAIPLLRMGVAREATKKIGTTLPGIGLITGHPIAAAGALMKDRVAQIGNRALFQLGDTAPQALANAAQRTATVGGSVGANQLANTQPQTPGMAAGGLVTPEPSVSSPMMSHPALAKWKPAFDKAAQGSQDPAEVEKAHTLTDYVLQQSDPAYAKAKQEAQENPMTPEPAQSEPQANMADGGVVTDPPEDEDNGFMKIKNFYNKIKEKAEHGPVIEDSNLAGLQNVANKQAGDDQSTMFQGGVVPKMSTPVDNIQKPKKKRKKGTDSNV